MSLYVSCDESGRVGACAEVEEYAAGMVEVTSIPDEWGRDGVRISDFVYSGGTLLYDPEPAPAPSSAEQLQTIARLAMPSIDFASVTATDVVAIPDYVPEWSTLIGQKLKHNGPCRYNGTIYRASQDVTVQAIYPPDVAGESQYYPIEVAPDGIIVYRPCHGEYDMVRAGETRHYPDAEGPVYRAKVDTAYDPDTVPGNWELVDGEPTEPDEGETTTEPEEPSDEPTEPTIPEFIQPTGAHDAYGIGDRVTYNGKVYESTMAGNAYSPDAYPQGWKLVE